MAAAGRIGDTDGIAQAAAEPRNSQKHAKQIQPCDEIALRPRSDKVAALSLDIGAQAKTMKTQTEIDYLAESEGYAQLYFDARIDSDMFVTLRSRASNEASDDEATSAHVSDEWARHATASSGFGDAVTELAMAGAHLRGSASAHRTGAFAGAFVAAIRAIGASLHQIYAWLRRAHPKERTMSSDDRADASRHKLRPSVAIAFRKIARAVDARTAHRMTRSFYRSSRMPWTAGLN